MFKRLESLVCDTLCFACSGSGLKRGVGLLALEMVCLKNVFCKKSGLDLVH